MTRRKFIQEIIKTASAIIVGTWCLAKKVAPRRFIRAVKLDKYPGSVKPLQHINEQGKWNG